MHQFLLTVVVGLSAFAAQGHAADEKSWELSPYRVQITVAADSTARPGAISADGLVETLFRRIRATIYPLWSAEIHTASGAERTILLRGLDSLSAESDKDTKAQFDKHMFLTAKVRPTGTVLSCREFDVFTGRWGPTMTRQVRQELLLPEQCFDLICHTFAPLAVVRADHQDEQHVTVMMKGAELPRQTSEELFVRAGDVYQPLLVRLSRTSGARPDLVLDLPWTFLSVEKSSNSHWQCLVHTGTHRPFGTRRHGRIETMALAVKHPYEQTDVRFYATHDEGLSLAGYEVFEQLPDGRGYGSLGVTDVNGVVRVKQAGSPVKMLLLRSDGQLLAKVPVVAGASRRIEIPIADDVARLLAQEELTALKEQLIDVVARRNILIARIRAQLGRGEIDQVDDLLIELNNLPDRAKFDRYLAEAQDVPAHRSKNPRVQSKIDKLFNETRGLLGRFLNISDVTQVEAEVFEYKKNKSK